jgi:hypothetical protein
LYIRFWLIMQKDCCNGAASCRRHAGACIREVETPNEWFRNADGRPKAAVSSDSAGASVAQPSRPGLLSTLRARPVAVVSALASGSIVAVFLILARLILAHVAAALGHVVVALAILGVLLLVVALTALLIALWIVALVAHGEMFSVWKNQPVRVVSPSVTRSCIGYATSTLRESADFSAAYNILRTYFPCSLQMPAHSHGRDALIAAGTGHAGASSAASSAPLVRSA